MFLFIVKSKFLFVVKPKDTLNGNSKDVFVSMASILTFVIIVFVILAM